VQNVPETAWRPGTRWGSTLALPDPLTTVKGLVPAGGRGKGEGKGRKGGEKGRKERGWEGREKGREGRERKGGERGGDGKGSTI